MRWRSFWQLLAVGGEPGGMHTHTHTQHTTHTHTIFFWQGVEVAYTKDENTLRVTCGFNVFATKSAKPLLTWAVKREFVCDEGCMKCFS